MIAEVGDGWQVLFGENSQPWKISKEEYISHVLFFFGGKMSVDHEFHQDAIKYEHRGQWGMLRNMPPS